MLDSWKIKLITHYSSMKHFILVNDVILLESSVIKFD